MKKRSGNGVFEAAGIEVVNNRDGQQMMIINRCSTQLGRPHRLKECIYCLPTEGLLGQNLGTVMYIMHGYEIWHLY